MKWIAAEVLAIVLVSLSAGTVYNLGGRHLDFFVSEPGRRYPNALVCRPGEVARVGAPGTTERQVPAPEDGPGGDGPGAKEAPAGDSDGGNGGAGTGTPPSSVGERKPVVTELTQIDTGEALVFWSDGFLFIDARRTRDYLEGHIRGAVSISAWEPGLEEKIQRLLDSGAVNPAEPVVTYCTAAEDCEDSRMVGENLLAFGFQNVMVYEGGFPAWKAAGNSIAAGEEPGRRGP